LHFLSQREIERERQKERERKREKERGKERERKTESIQRDSCIIGRYIAIRQKLAQKGAFNFSLKLSLFLFLFSKVF
jgi:hypothetical protein